MSITLHYMEAGFSIVADDTADLLKVFDHVMEGPQVVEVRNVVNVEGPSPWAVGETFADDAPVSVGPLIGEELNTGEVVGAIVSHADGTETVNNVPEWITWNGGECPVDKYTRVEVKFRCGDTDKQSIAASWDWWHGQENATHDIIAYRVIA